MYDHHTKINCISILEKHSLKIYLKEHNLQKQLHKKCSQPEWKIIYGKITSK